MRMSIEQRSDDAVQIQSTEKVSSVEELPNATGSQSIMETEHESASESPKSKPKFGLHGYMNQMMNLIALSKALKKDVETPKVADGDIVKQPNKQDDHTDQSASNIVAEDKTNVTVLSEVTADISSHDVRGSQSEAIPVESITDLSDDTYLTSDNVGFEDVNDTRGRNCSICLSISISKH